MHFTVSKTQTEMSTLSFFFIVCQISAGGSVSAFIFTGVFVQIVASSFFQPVRLLNGSFVLLWTSAMFFISFPPAFIPPSWASVRPFFVLFFFSFPTSACTPLDTEPSYAQTGKSSWQCDSPFPLLLRYTMTSTSVVFVLMLAKFFVFFSSSFRPKWS